LQHAAESSFSLNRKLNPKTGAFPKAGRRIQLLPEAQQEAIN
jgi:hypothetical protein